MQIKQRSTSQNLPLEVSALEAVAQMFARTDVPEVASLAALYVVVILLVVV
jgi:hypothetical protein